MKVQNSSLNNQKTTNCSMAKMPKSPAFKAGYTGALSATGNVMQGIENQGFWLLFIIQDFLGMTTPRTIAGFLRDKEVTGEYNVQEGFEVLGREGLTGPCMMAVAPIGLAVAALFGKATSMNSRLIRRFGNSLKGMVSGPEFDKALLKNKDQFKTSFYKENIQKMLKETLGEKNVSQKDIDFVLQQVQKYENPAKSEIKGLFGKSKYQSQRIGEISEYIDNIRYSSTDELGNLQKIKFDGTNFSVKDTIDGMVKYSNDAININKHLDKMDASMAEDIKNSSLAKRFITNISLMASTLGVLSILPKIYARSKVPPGALTANKLKEAQLKDSETNNIDNNTQQASTSAQEEVKEPNEIAFKGKNNPKGMSKLGKFLSKFMSEKYAGELEYNGQNFTNSLMAGLSVFGLLAPRGWHAYQRAPKMDNGKKDLTELWEIGIRDLISSLSVVFAVPMLTRAFVTSYEKKSGYVLLNKERGKSNLKVILDLFNPYSKAHVMTNSEIASLYNGVNTKEKMLNFCKYIDKNEGDLEKILSKSTHAKEIFTKDTLDLEGMAKSKMKKQEKNKKILEYFEKLGSDGKLSKKSVDELICKLMRGTEGKMKGNKIASIARGLNSLPGAITTFLISPVILGWIIPRLTYANTRRIHAKHEKEANEKKAQTNKVA